MKNFLEKIYLNPINLSIILSAIFALILFHKYHLVIPEYYIDKVLAHQMINSDTGVYIEKLYKQPLYDFQNTLYHFFAMCLASCLVFGALNLKTWDDCLKVKRINDCAVIFIIVNCLYPIWAYFTVKVVEIDIDKFVYPVSADTTFIPIFGMYVLLILGGIVYYVMINIFMLITYFLRKFRAFSKAFVIFFRLIILFNLFLCVISQFSWIYVILYFIIFLFAFITISFVNCLESK